MYDGYRTGFDACKCEEVYFYVYLYKDVDVYEGHEAGFCVVYLGACLQDQRKTQLFCII